MFKSMKKKSNYLPKTAISEQTSKVEFSDTPDRECSHFYRHNSVKIKCDPIAWIEMERMERNKININIEKTIFN